MDASFLSLQVIVDGDISEEEVLTKPSVKSRKRSAPGAALASGLTGEQWYLQQAARYKFEAEKA